MLSFQIGICDHNFSFTFMKCRITRIYSLQKSGSNFYLGWRLKRSHPPIPIILWSGVSVGSWTWGLTSVTVDSKNSLKTSDGSNAADIPSLIPWIQCNIRKQNGCMHSNDRALALSDHPIFLCFPQAKVSHQELRYFFAIGKQQTSLTGHSRPSMGQVPVGSVNTGTSSTRAGLHGNV